MTEVVLGSHILRPVVTALIFTISEVFREVPSCSSFPTIILRPFLCHHLPIPTLIPAAHIWRQEILSSNQPNHSLGGVFSNKFFKAIPQSTKSLRALTINAAGPEVGRVNGVFPSALDTILTCRITRLQVQRPEKSVVNSERAKSGMSYLQAQSNQLREPIKGRRLQDGSCGSLAQARRVTQSRIFGLHRK